MKIIEIFLIFLRLGLTSFGGPIAHLGYFHDELVKRRKWLDEHSYADLVALCQFLPGPASSQVGIAIGLSRGGVFGAIAAWLGFTLPSAVLLVIFALGVSNLSTFLGTGWLHGLKIAAVAIVAQALWSMGMKLSVGKIKSSITLGSAIVISWLPFAFGQIGIIALGAIVGWRFIEEDKTPPHTPIKTGIGKPVAAVILGSFFILLVALPLLSKFSDSQPLKLFDSFFRAGSLVFGGGHVVLPLLKSEVVNPGWVTGDAFMAGYGAAQAIPGPLFTFSAYLGAISQIPPSGWIGAAICLVAAFLPSFFLVFGTFPFWEEIRQNKAMRSAMAGINAAVVGLLLSAFFNPVWSSAISSPKDYSIALLGFLLLVFWKMPSWAVVFVTAIVSGLLL
jgi:chromate transporter